MAELSNILNHSTILNIGTFDGNVLIKAMKKMETYDYEVGADIYYGGFKGGIVDLKGQELESGHGLSRVILIGLKMRSRNIFLNMITI